MVTTTKLQNYKSKKRVILQRVLRFVTTGFTWSLWQLILDQELNNLE